jgi:hypothetical protein
MNMYLKFVLWFLVVIVAVYAALVGMDVFSGEAFALAASGVLAVVFELAPGMKEWHNELTADQKRLVMIILLVIMVYGALGLTCFNIIVAFPCTGQGALDALLILFLAAGANQGTQKLAKRFARK